MSKTDEEFKDGLRTAVEKSRKNISSFGLVVLLPLALKDYKEKDPEFFYETKKDFKEILDILASHKKTLEEMLDKLDGSNG